MQAYKVLGSNQAEINSNGISLLMSYNTPVAAHIEGKGYIKTSTKWSVTTSKHIDKWLDGFTAELVDQSVLDNFKLTIEV